LILLGAGASKPFGLKTLQDLTEDIVEQMRSKGHGETIDIMLEALRKFGFTPDFENIYTILEALVDPYKGVQFSSPFTAFIAHFCRGFEDIRKHQEFTQVLQDFRDLIYTMCSIKRGVMRKQKSVYDRLFEAINKASRRLQEKRVLSSVIGGSGNMVNIPVQNTIVTTNYDMSIELYHRLIQKPLADGFEPSNDEYVKELNFTDYFRKGEYSTWLIKLHGAIWQFKQENRIIKTIGPPESSPLEIKVDEQMMIYPIGEKPIMREPYYSFYRIFKEQPWLKMIAVGYSFRDEPVNIAIAENLERNKDATLILLNPEPEKAIRNFESASKFSDRIIPVHGNFGDEKLFEKLTAAVDSIHWNQYNRRMWQYFKERALKLSIQ